MMTEEHIKEAISLRYMELIAAYNGYDVSNSKNDYGRDLQIDEVDLFDDGRFLSTNRSLHFQVKSTTTKSIIEENESIKYDLKAKNYNDLIALKDTASPLILLLFVLPENKNNWLELTKEELITRKCAYWFMPSETASKTDNNSTIRIDIDKRHLVDLETIDLLFKKYL